MPHISASRRKRWFFDQAAATSDAATNTDPATLGGLVTELEPDGFAFLSGRGGSSTFNYWTDDEYETTNSSTDNFVAFNNDKPVAGATFNSLDSLKFTEDTKAHIYNGSADGGTGSHLYIPNWSYDGSTATGFFTTFFVIRDTGDTSSGDRVLMSSNSVGFSMPSTTSTTGIWVLCASHPSSPSYFLSPKVVIRAGSGSGSSDLYDSGYITPVSSAPKIPSAGNGTVLCVMRGARSTDGGSNWTQAIRIATLANEDASGIGTGGTSWKVSGTWDCGIGTVTGGDKLFFGGLGFQIGSSSTNVASGTEIAHIAHFSERSADSDEILQYTYGDYQFAFAGCTAPDHGNAHPTRSADLIGNFFKHTYAMT